MKHKHPYADTASQVQRARILAALRIGPKTSHDLRRLGCYQCPARILELRRKGYAIDTELVSIYDADGYHHKGVARYHLMAEPDRPTNDEAPTVGAVQGLKQKKQNEGDSTAARRARQALGVIAAGLFTADAARMAGVLAKAIKITGGLA